LLEESSTVSINYYLSDYFEYKALLYSHSIAQILVIFGSCFIFINILNSYKETGPLHPHIQKQFNTIYQFNPADRPKPVSLFTTII